MKLHAEHALALHGGGEASVVVGGCDLVICVARRIRVHEVERCAVRDSVEQRSARRHASPADLRDRQYTIEATYCAAHEPETTRRLAFIGRVEEQLMSDADAEQKRAARDGVRDGGVDVRRTQPLPR